MGDGSLPIGSGDWVVEYIIQLGIGGKGWQNQLKIHRRNPDYIAFQAEALKERPEWQRGRS